MQYWWVNQNKTYNSEVPGGFLWSPKVKSDGRRNQFYDYMKDVLPGDIVFSFCDTRIKAIGIAVATAESSPKPDYGKSGASWLKDGWLVSVEFKELNNKIRPKNNISLLLPHLPAKYSPLQTNGNGLQSVYLTKVPSEMADVLIDIIGNEYFLVFRQLQNKTDLFDITEDSDEIDIRGRTDIGETTIDQLIKSRRGQGVFKANVRLNEKCCRITKICDQKHLIASHIKPWKDCTDVEKLDGCNGLLLAPHIDHLFDKGYLSFEDNGDIICSSKLSHDVLQAWSVSANNNVGPFNSNQKNYLRYHRNNVFK